MAERPFSPYKATSARKQHAKMADRAPAQWPKVPGLKYLAHRSPPPRDLPSTRDFTGITISSAKDLAESPPAAAKPCRSPATLIEHHRLPKSMFLPVWCIYPPRGDVPSTGGSTTRFAIRVCAYNSRAKKARTASPARALSPLPIFAESTYAPPYASHQQLL